MTQAWMGEFGSNFIHKQHISHFLHVINQGAGKFILTIHKNPFKTAAAAR